MVNSVFNVLLSFLFLPTNLLLADFKLPWIVYYNDQAHAEDLMPYNPIVLQSQDHPDLKPLLEREKELLGYLNIGEIDQKSPEFSLLQKEGIIISENESWPESYSIDIRDPLWKKIILNDLIPQIVEQGFTGLLLDQIDVSLALEESDPKKYAGMKAAAIDLVQSIHKEFPNLKLMLNRGYEILPSVGDSIQYELAEALYSEYDFKTKKYFVISKEERSQQLTYLYEARKKFPHITLFSLDYWDPKDKEMYKKIYALERKECIRPFVSSVWLDTIVSEP